MATNRACNLSTYSCGPCDKHSDCASGACKADHSCAAPNDVAYVNVDAAACSDTPHTSTRALPYCQIQAAATLANMPYVVVAGSNSKSYSAVNITSLATPIGPLTIIGPGRTPAAGAPTAVIAPTAASPALFVDASGNTATVTVDGLELMSGTASPVVKCSGGTAAASLSVLGSFVHGGVQAGIDSAGCTVVIDSNVVANNTGGGIIYRGGPQYTITNNLIHDNVGSSAVGVRFDDSPAGSVFAFNTVVSNGGAGNSAAGGVVCNNVSASIQASIVASNTLTSASGTQFGGGAACQLQNVVVGADSTSATGAIKKAPALAADGHLDIGSAATRATNADCCTDKLAAPGTPSADHDVDRTPRPKGTGATPYDIGAHEAL